MKTTLWNILTDNVKEYSVPNGITIPKIQRDYAQGRETIRAIEIRKEFLKNIHQFIEINKLNSEKSLDLDFVYGTNYLGSFIPLDGQQRLTTLFLLHWYLAFKENKLNLHRDYLSKFNYETRPTSNLFLKALCKNFGENENEIVFSNTTIKSEQLNSFRNLIKNKNWYFSAWKYDNSIEAMITMLDTIHLIFKDSDISIDDLIKQNNPPITFNFLQLETYGLSDSLYIKMNARGKQLTSFENLKAQIAKLIKESTFNYQYNYQLSTSSGEKKVDVETYFVTRIDTIWTDYFWKIRDENNRFDNKLLNLLTFISLNELIKIDIELYEIAIHKLSTIDEISYYSLKDLGLLNEKSIIKYIDILDVLSSTNSDILDYLNNTDFEVNILSHAFSNKVNPDYEKRILFQGIFDFILSNKSSPSLSELKKWSKLLFNLAHHTIYDNSKDFLSSLNGLETFLSNYNNNIYRDFIEFSIKGFDTIQTKEELIKHQLKTVSNNWIDLIERIENHGFLNGQISVLLVISSIYETFELKSVDELTYNEIENLCNLLEYKFSVFNLLFNSDGLIKFPEEEFRRALLCYGDYAIYSTNWFFYNNTNHRDLSWKRLLKETANKSNTYMNGVIAFVKLFEDLNNSELIEKQLKNIISKYLNTNEQKDWKYYFIKYPILFLSSKKHYIKFINSSDHKYIYCLNKSKYNKDVDFDFMSLILKSKLEKKGIDTNKIEFQYNYKYNQFGISKIKGKSIKIIYNSPTYNHQFLIKKHGENEIIMTKKSEVINYIIENYF